MPSYFHLPFPPEPFTKVLVQLPNFTRIEREVYAWETRDEKGAPHLELVSLTEYLWRAIQMHCEHGCHVLYLSLRGAWRGVGRPSPEPHHEALVEMGDNSLSHTIPQTPNGWPGPLVVQHPDWDEFVKELCLKLMPGWWQPVEQSE